MTLTLTLTLTLSTTGASLTWTLTLTLPCRWPVALGACALWGPSAYRPPSTRAASVLPACCVRACTRSNPYNLGAGANFRETFDTGGSLWWITWMLPTTRRKRGQGFRLPTNKEHAGSVALV